jgi:hypothetical protein
MYVCKGMPVAVAVNSNTNSKSEVQLHARYEVLRQITSTSRSTQTSLCDVSHTHKYDLKL